MPERTTQLSHREYTRLVDEGNFPDDPRVPLDEPFVNAAGTILNVLLERFTSAAFIQSNEYAIRGNHYHKTDWHYSFVVSGSVHYAWQPADGATEPQVKVFTAGQLFFTPPLVEHAMYFPVPTCFMTFARNLRDHESHESDVVRVQPLLRTAWSATDGVYTCEMSQFASTGTGGVGVA